MLHCKRLGASGKYRKFADFSILVGAVACSLVMASPAFSQSAPAGYCQIFVDPNYGGAAGNIVGTAEKGDVVMFTTEEQAPKDTVKFLKERVGYRVFYDPSWNDSISSVKVAQGCTVELHNNLEIHQQGSTHPHTSYTSDTASIGDEDNKAKMAICRCPS